MSFGHMTMMLAAVQGGLPLPYLSTIGLSATNLSNGDAGVSMTCQNDGDLSTGSSNVSQTPTESDRTDEWLLDINQGTGAGADYECRLVTVTGTVSAGSSSVDTWLNLGTSRQWKQYTTGEAAKSFTGTLEIGYAGLNTALASCSVTLSSVSTTI